MHELSLVQSVLDMIEDHARQHRFDRVTSVKLSCGRLSGVEPSCLRFAFEAQSKGTRAEGATLELEVLPAAIYCFSCEQNSTLEQYTAFCPLCHGTEVILAGGTEELKFIEMEVE
jgi:hydrogenase nickel incorporation protein HypA/HybF